MIGDELEITVGIDGIGKRIDKFLADGADSISRTRVKKSFDGGFVVCDGKPVQAKHVLRGGEVIKFCPIFADATPLRPAPIPLDILFEDGDIIIVNKPAGIVVHPGNGTVAPTLVEGILSHCNLSFASGKLRPGVVHRLDRDTSGVIVFAKTDTAHLRLVRMFAGRRVEKIYDAIICGVFYGNFGEICLPIGRNRAIRTKMAVSEGGKKAITRWRNVKTFGEKFSHLRVNILTGRTHQIRVHMANARHPIVGDTAYGYNKNYSPLVTPQRPMLHASELAFHHPCSGEKISAMARLPADFTDILRAIDSQ
jgi:23S rRNA pseudouridine1911/1915/1917 synthase